MANIYSQNISAAPQGESINDIRRVFNFGERVSELNPAASPFFSYLSKVSKKPTDDPVFKFLEKRHQWQRRNFKKKVALTVINGSTVGSVANAKITAKDFDVDYDVTGRKDGVAAMVEFATVGQTFAVQAVYNDGADKDVILYYRITAVTQNSGNSDKDTSLTADFLAATYVPKATQANLDDALSVTQAAGALAITDVASSHTLTIPDNAEVLFKRRLLPNL